MFATFLKLAIRNLLRHKEYFLINVFGLAVGMACAIMVLIFVWEQSNYDNFHPSSDRLYRVYLDSKIGGVESQFAITSGRIANGLNTYVPEIEEACRIFKADRDVPITSPQVTVLKRTELVYADSTFFDLFGFKLLQGDPKNCLRKSRSIVLSKSLARKLFPEGAMGKMITVSREDVLDSLTHKRKVLLKQWTVTGVLEDCPGNTHLGYRALVSWNSLDFQGTDNWENHNVYTYMRLSEDADMSNKVDNVPYGMTPVEYKMNMGFHKEAGDKLGKLVGVTADETYSDREYILLRLQKITSIHLFSHLKFEHSQNVNIQTLLIIAGISFLIILIACINYANLSTARLAGRVREIGIRKLLGSQRREIAFQLMAESITISFISLFFALVFVELIYPNSILQSQSDDTSVMLKVMAISPTIFLFTLITGILAGSYPAFYIIRFTPAEILNQQKKFSVGGKGLRAILVIIQFVFSLVIIYSTSTIYRQLRYVHQKGIGFNKEQLLIVQNLTDHLGNQSKLIRDLKQISEIKSFSFSSNVPFKGIGQMSFQKLNDSTRNYMMYYIECDTLFLKTYGMNLVSGSFKLGQQSAADTMDVVVNEDAIRHFEFQSPIGTVISRKSSVPGMRIRGVVSDFNFESLHSEIQPLIFLPADSTSMRFLSIRFNQAVNDELVEKVREVWEINNPNSPFTKFTVDENFSQFYGEEKSTGEVAVVFSFFAIFIACMGLYSLLALTTVSRTKEIGIRKVLGANTIELVILLSKEIFRLIVIAGVIALPVAYSISYYWLKRFAYHVNLSFVNYLIVFVAVLAVAIFTIYRQLWYTIKSDPGESLRSQ